MNEENKIVENETEVNSETPMIFAEKTKRIIDNTQNKFLKGFYIFIFYIANIFVDFARGCKRNPSKIAGILIAAPGVFIGFLLGIQIDALYYLSGLKWAPLALFVLVMFGAVNIFNASSVISKRSLGAFIASVLVTLLIDVFGIIYIVEVIDAISYNTEINSAFEVTASMIESLISVGVSMLLCTAGCVLAFIFRDKNYQRDRS
ncbi:MAG: hypothetical protein ACI35W_04850 [Anaeroplasmataceae bacterium]